MSLLTKVTLVLLCVTFLTKEGHCVDVVASPHGFCYEDETCDPKHWGGTCETGKSQSPIDLPKMAKKVAKEGIKLPVAHFVTDHFFMQNNGHTVNMDFAVEGEEGKSYDFPGSKDANVKFRLSNAHFHWGKTDADGSEHSIGGETFSMEMHLVHYNEKYKTPAKAIASGDKDALAVIGILLKADPNTKPNPALEPIVQQTNAIKDVHTLWTKVDEVLDLTSFIPPKGSPVYHYNGSLTTPGCNEQVNWYVFADSQKIASSDVEAFRGIEDGEHHGLVVNHRPVQPINGRKVQLLKLE